MYMNHKQIPSQEIINKTIESLKTNGMTARVVANSDEAREAVIELLPKGSSVMTMTSETLREIGIEQIINTGSDYVSLKNKLYSMDRSTQSHEMQSLGAAPEYAIGSVHAITEAGEIIVASNTGSQLPAYAYGAAHVIWVVGAQKIVDTLHTGMKRIREYVLPLESERAKKAYGAAGSNISKMLIVNNEVNPGRINLIIVKEELGY
jgi:hypothetical protein